MAVLTRPSLVIAHRGASAEAPENTVPAFAAAIAAGADGIEFDVQLSRDRVPVVIHDETLDRTTDARGPVAALSAGQLAALDATGGRAGAVPAGVPRLEEVLALAAGSRLLVNIELKNSVVDYPGLEEAVLEAVAFAGLAERVVLSSFSIASVRRLALLTPIEVALVYSRPWLRPLALAADLGLRAIHPSRALAGRVLVARAHRQGVAVRPWVVNGAARVRRAAAIGVDGFFTDDPAVALLALGRGRPGGSAQLP